jgi:Domain of unknown function (DUF4157)
VIQPKLRMGTPGDKYEREADQVANEVTQFPHRHRHHRWTTPAEESENTGRVRSSRGDPLDPATREFMESRFGHSFNHVRIHSGAEGAASGRPIHARAYTVGADIVFARGEYAPDTQGGERLLAHELTHVIQQSPHTPEPGGRRVSKAPAPLVQCAPLPNPESARLHSELKELLTLKQELLDDIATAKPEDQAAFKDAILSVQSQIDDVVAEFRNLEGGPKEKRKHAEAGEVYGLLGLGLVTTGRVYDDPAFAGTPAHRRRMAELGGDLLASKHARAPKETFKRTVKERQRGQRIIEELPETIKQSRERLLKWPAEIAEQTIKSGAGFVAGFLDGMSRVELTDDQKSRLGRNLAWTAVLMPGVSAGMTYGIAEEARTTLVGLLDLEEASAALSELVGLVLSRGGETIARELGIQVAGQVKGDIDELIAMSPWTFGFALGEKTGPILAGIVLAIVSGGAGAAARMVAILNRIPGGRKLITRLKGKRAVGSHPPSAPSVREGTGIPGPTATQEKVGTPSARSSRELESTTRRDIQPKKRNVMMEPDAGSQSVTIQAPGRPRIQKGPGAGRFGRAAAAPSPATASTSRGLGAATISNPPAHKRVRVSAGAYSAPTRKLKTPREAVEAERMGFREPTASEAVSVTAKEDVGINKAIRPNIAEQQTWDEAIFARNEIGLQGPTGSIVEGPDFITAQRMADGQLEIIVTDVASTETGKLARKSTDIPEDWLRHVESAISPERLDLGDADLEARIIEAFHAGRVRRRQISVDFSPAGQGTVTGW